MEDQLDRFERIINLVERVRKLDFLTIDAMSQLNQKSVEFCQQMTQLNTEYQRSQLNLQKPEPEERKMEMSDTVSLLIEALQKIKASEVPTPVPIPAPTPAPIPVPIPVPEPPKEEPKPKEKDTSEFLGRVKKLSATINDHIKSQVDIHKHAYTTIVETQKMSFELWKEIDDFMTTKK